MLGTNLSVRVRRYKDLERGINKKEGTELYGYLDNLDRASGINYNDYWGRKRPNATDLVDSVQTMVESTPGPFSKIVSQEMWYV